MNRLEFIDWYEDVRVGTRRLILMVPEEAMDYRLHRNGPTIEMLMRSFASLEEQYLKGVCIGDWSDSSSPTDIRRQLYAAFAEDTDDKEGLENGVEKLDSPEEIVDHLDYIHQQGLDILADLSDEEFQLRKTMLPWGESGTIVRLLLGLVEREIHHRTELYCALQSYGIDMSTMMIWGP